MSSRILGIAAFILIIITLYMALIYAPTEATMGVIQRISYFHIPMGLLSYASAFLLFVGSMMYLIQRDLMWDRFSIAAAELGLLVTSCSIVTGMIWAKPVWGVWWAFDARLTLQLILWLIYVAYFMLRAYLPDRDRRAKLASVFGLLGMIDVPINYKSIEWWTTQHPQPVMRGGGSMDPDMRLALYVAFLAFGVLYAYLFTRRAAIAKVEAEVDYLDHLVTAHE
jgi:heme exporter protein C